MSDTNNDIAEEQPRTRGRKSKMRRRFATELAALEGRVGLAVTMLKRVKEDDPAVAKRIVEIAIETLEGS